MVKNYINKSKPVYKSYTLNNIHYFEIDSININNGLSYVFNLSELDKLHQKNKPLKLLIEYDVLATFASYKCMKQVRDRALTSNNFFDIYYFLNKDLHAIKLIYNSDNSYNTINAISEQVKKLLLKSSMMIHKVLLRVDFIHIF